MKEPLERELDYNYKIFVFNQIQGAGSDDKRKWLIYDNIIEELYNIGKYNIIDEIKYRITDSEDDKKVFITSLEKIKNKTHRLNLLINSI